MSRTAFLGIFLAIFTGCRTPAMQQQEHSGERYDLVIRNGMIVDGSGGTRYLADVAIASGRIAAIGRVAAGSATSEIDAKGMVVAPGFIDVHTHVDSDILRYPLAENFVRDGVTTIVSGNCGSSVRDVGALFRQMKEKGAAVNVATLIGHNTVLRAVKGDRAGDLTPAQMAEAKEIVRQAMVDGAMGLSTGLIYLPGKFSKTEEIVELQRVAAAHGGLYATHMRSEAGGILDAIDEAIEIGRRAGSRVHISHFKLPTDAARKLGGASATLGQVAEARADGMEIWLDQYPYTASSTSISTLLPDELMTDGIAQARQKLKQPDGYERWLAAMVREQRQRGRTHLGYVVVASSSAYPQYNGRNLVQIAQTMNLKHQDVQLLSEKTDTGPTLEDQCRAAMDLFIAGDTSCVFHTMNETEVETIMRSPIVAVASDSGLRVFGAGVPHPRGYGTNTRVLGRYVRERRIITLEEGVRKMTSLPAHSFRMKDRGLLKVGYQADVTIFDPGTVVDHATFEKPHQYPTGISHVLVNGQVVFSAGRMSGVLPGQAVRNAAQR